MHSGAIVCGLCPAPQGDRGLCRRTIFREPLLFVSDQPNRPASGPVGLQECVGRKILLVQDACGLSDTVRLLFRKADLAPDECEGRALGYHMLEKSARMGIGVTLLPASQVPDWTHARP